MLEVNQEAMAVIHSFQLSSRRRFNKDINGLSVCDDQFVKRIESDINKHIDIYSRSKTSEGHNRKTLTHLFKLVASINVPFTFNVQTLPFIA